MGCLWKPIYCFIINEISFGGQCFCKLRSLYLHRCSLKCIISLFEPTLEFAVLELWKLEVKNVNTLVQGAFKINIVVWDTIPICTVYISLCIYTISALHRQIYVSRYWLINMSLCQLFNKCIVIYRITLQSPFRKNGI